VAASLFDVEKFTDSLLQIKPSAQGAVAKQAL